MTDDRARILARISGSLQTAHLPDACTTLISRTKPSTPFDTAALVGLFTRELTALKGIVHAPRSPMQAIETVIELLRESGGEEVLAWAGDALPVAGLDEAMRHTGFKALDLNVPVDPRDRRERQMQLARALAGVTGALAGLADTGSIVVTSGAGRPRLASLLPSMHIALLRIADLYPGLLDFFAAQPDIVREGSNVVIITGPSRTADIELTPVLGVHGPRILHAVLIA